MLSWILVYTEILSRVWSCVVTPFAKKQMMNLFTEVLQFTCLELNNNTITSIGTPLF